MQRLGLRPGPMDADYATAIGRGEVHVTGDPIALRAEADHLAVDVVAVDPAAQAAGLGRTLMAFAEGEARRLGLPELRLLTNELMAENLRFYERLGFEEYDRRAEYETRRVYLRKRLADDAAG